MGDGYAKVDGRAIRGFPESTIDSIACTGIIALACLRRFASISNLVPIWTLQSSEIELSCKRELNFQDFCDLL